MAENATPKRDLVYWITVVVTVVAAMLTSGAIPPDTVWARIATGLLAAAGALGFVSRTQQLKRGQG